MARSTPPEYPTKVYLNVHLNVHLICSDMTSILVIPETDRRTTCSLELIKVRGGCCHEETGGADAGLGGAGE